LCQIVNFPSGFFESQEKYKHKIKEKQLVKTNENDKGTWVNPNPHVYSNMALNLSA